MKTRALWIVALAVACSSATEPDRVRVMGTIDGYNDDDPRIELSQSGRSVTVSVTTYGDGCYTAGETEVDLEGLVAVVTPYDYTAPPGTVCTRILRQFEHTATIDFEPIGTATIVVRGLTSLGEEITVPHQVMVF